VPHVRQLYPDTYIYIYGDHTPFTIKQGEYRRCAFKQDGKTFEFVPLVIVTPNETRHLETRQAASFLDVAPTLLFGADISFEFRSEGKNLLKPKVAGGLVPFQGGRYDREWLFQKAASTATKQENLPSSS
jgi:lipoteichoic acid synthase